MEENHKNLPNEEEKAAFDIQEVRKPTYLTRVNYKASAEEHKITHAAMQKIQRMEYYKKEDGYIYVDIPLAELRNATGHTGNNLFDRLNDVANHMTGRNAGIVDKEHHRFSYIAIISKAEYENGVMTIRFAPEITSSLIEVGKSFTALPNYVVYQFKHNYTYPMYQFLKSRSYYPLNYVGVKNYVFKTTIGINELKLLIGVVNSNEDRVKTILNNTDPTEETYEKAVAASNEKMFERWDNFKLKVIESSLKEINEFSDIYVEYKPIPKKRKYVAIEFVIWTAQTDKVRKNKRQAVEIKESKADYPNISDIEKYAFEKQIMEYFSKYGITEKDANKLAIILSYDDEILKKVYEYIINYNKPIPKLVGFISTLIEEGWDIDKKEGYVPENKSKSKNSFHHSDQAQYDIPALEKKLFNHDNEKPKSKNPFLNFKQNTYNFEELEKQLLANGTDLPSSMDGIKGTDPNYVPTEEERSHVTTASVKKTTPAPDNSNDNVNIMETAGVKEYSAAEISNEIRKMVQHDNIYTDSMLVENIMIIMEIAENANGNIERVRELYNHALKNPQDGDVLQYIKNNI